MQLNVMYMLQRRVNRKKDTKETINSLLVSKK